MEVSLAACTELINRAIDPAVCIDHLKAAARDEVTSVCATGHYAGALSVAMLSHRTRIA